MDEFQEEAKNYISQAREFPTLKWISFTGGEPFLLPDMLVELVSYVSNLGNLGCCNAGLSADFFSNLLSAIDSFSVEVLGIELCELATQKQRVFLNRIDGMILAVVAEGSAFAYLAFRPRMFSLMERIRRILESVEVWPSQLEAQEDLEVLACL